MIMAFDKYERLGRIVGQIKDLNRLTFPSLECKNDVTAGSKGHRIVGRGFAYRMSTTFKAMGYLIDIVQYLKLTNSLYMENRIF